MPVFQLDHMVRNDVEICRGISEYVIQYFSQQDTKFNQVELKAGGYRIACVLVILAVLLLSSTKLLETMNLYLPFLLYNYGLSLDQHSAKAQASRQAN